MALHGYESLYPLAPFRSGCCLNGQVTHSTLVDDVIPVTNISTACLSTLIRFADDSKYTCTHAMNE